MYTRATRRSWRSLRPLHGADRIAAAQGPRMTSSANATFGPFTGPTALKQTGFSELPGLRRSLRPLHGADRIEARWPRRRRTPRAAIGPFTGPTARRRASTSWRPSARRGTPLPCRGGPRQVVEAHCRVVEPLRDVVEPLRNVVEPFRDVVGPLRDVVELRFVSWRSGPPPPRGAYASAGEGCSPSELSLPSLPSSPPTSERRRSAARERLP